jgi:CubicO group peptidase (beta-lactamase class C family)
MTAIPAASPSWTRVRAAATWLACGASLALATAAAAQTERSARPPLAAAVRDSLRREIRRLVDSTGVASVTVAVARDGEIWWEEGFGYADLARRIPADPSTLYSLASISKPFTATAVMQLVEQGRVDLDRPVDDYLGGVRITGLAGDRAGATVRRVLSHTAGLPLHYHFFYKGDTTPPDVRRAIARYGRTVFPPGEVYSYSNLGFGILGEMAGQVAGTSYESYMRDRVFRPLGLTSTTIGTGEGIANSAVRYDGAHRPIPYYDFDHRGASAIYSSAHELVRFGMFHLKQQPRDAPATWKRVLADSTIERMQRIATPGDSSSGYGLGWFVDDDLGIRRVRHTGGMPGVATILSLYPTQGLVVVVLSNQSSGLPGRIATEIASAVLPPSYGRALAARRAATPAPQLPFRPAPELVGEWRGTLRTYEDTIPMVVRIDSADVRVQLGGPNALWTLLNRVTFRNQLLAGQFVGTIPTAEALRVPHVVGVQLQLRDGMLRGWGAAQADTETNDYSLSSYVQLVRAATTGTRAAQ